MASRKVVQLKRKIYDKLRDCDVKIVILVGEPGVGKTRTAKQISDCAVKEGLFESSLWVFLNRDYDEVGLRDSIARQLSLLTVAEEWEAEYGKKEAEKEEKPGPGDGQNDAEKKEKNHEDIQQMLFQQRLMKRIKEMNFILILDDVGDKMDEKGNILDEKLLKLELLNLLLKHSKKVISTRTSDALKESEILVEQLSVEESISLLRKRVGRKAYPQVLQDSIEAFIRNTEYHLPAAIILMEKALSYFGERDSKVQMLESALKEACDNGSFNVTQLLRCAGDIVPKSILIDCFRCGSHFLWDHGSIHYNALIAYWIIEGYLGHVDCIQEAYEKGHSVLMELVDCLVLKKLEGGYVVMDGLIKNLDDSDHSGFGGTARLGLDDVFQEYRELHWDGLGRITQTDGMIKSFGTGQRGQKLSTMLVDGKCFVEIPNSLSTSKKELQVLAVFNPNIESLTSLLSHMQELVVLVLRGCDFLKNIDEKIDLKRLTVLEISNASSLETIPDDIFDAMSKLRSLHLSELKVTSLPSSLFNLKELCWLILRGCSCFETLGSLKNFKNLLVLDVSGASSLTHFVDKTFKHTTKLQVLDLSRTKIERLPKLFSLRELTFLSLSGCESLQRMPKTDSLSSLKTLDLSCAKKFNEFREQTFGDCGGPEILDLSETCLENLPSKMNPRTLFLRHCANLKILPLIEALKDLEVLDLSGTKSLVKIEDKFFDHLKSLRILNLSETGIKNLPSLSNLSSLCQLLLSGCTDLMVIEHESLEQMSGLRSPNISETGIKYVQFLPNPGNITVLSLKNCTSLKVLPPLESLSNLQELNLCGISLEETGAGFLEHMSSLKILDLSETQLEQLPTISNLRSLCQLYLRGCQSLKEVPGLDTLTQLEVLDLSGTAVAKLPSFKDFSNLRQLMLADCPGLQEFLQREICDGQRLYLSNMKNAQGVGSSKMKERHVYEDSSSLAAETSGHNNKTCVSASSSQFLQILENNPSFHFSIHPTVKQDGKGVASSYGDNLMFRDIFIQSSQFSEQRSLLIRGFNHSPEGIADVLCHADCSFCIDTEFEKCLSHQGASNLNMLKGYWIERCREMETIFYEEEVKEKEVLWVSNSVNFERIHGNWQSDTFQNLRELYLDCCPRLSIVFSSSQLPKMLEVLKIKFCDELEAVFELASPKPELPYLRTLCLWELPKLRTTGCALPSLQTRKVWKCPKLEDFKENVKLDRSS